MSESRDPAGEPPRLLDAGDEVSARLLRAAVTEDPPGNLEDRVLAGLGVPPVVGLGLGASAAGKAAAGKAAQLALLKWAGLGVIASGLAMGGYAISRSEPRPAETTLAPPTTSAPIAVPAPPRHPPVAAASSVAPEPAPSAAPAPSSTGAAPPPARAAASGFAVELGRLDEVRAALARGDGRAALRYLDRFGADFPRSSLSQEATMLRIEALVAVGDRAAATALADRFLATAPDSPYADRIRTLVGSR